MTFRCTGTVVLHKFAGFCSIFIFALPRENGSDGYCNQSFMNIYVILRFSGNHAIGIAFALIRTKFGHFEYVILHDHAAGIAFCKT